MSSIPESDTGCLSRPPRALAAPQVCTPNYSWSVQTPELLKARTASLLPPCCLGWTCTPARSLTLQDTAVAPGQVHTLQVSRAAQPRTHKHMLGDHDLCPQTPDGSSLCFQQRDPGPPHGLSQPVCLGPVAPPSSLLTWGRQGARESRRWAEWGAHWRGALSFWSP